MGNSPMFFQNPGAFPRKHLPLFRNELKWYDKAKMILKIIIADVLNN